MSVFASRKKVAAHISALKPYSDQVNGLLRSSRRIFLINGTKNFHNEEQDNHHIKFLSRSISANLNILVVPEEAYQRIRNMRLMERFIK